MKKQILIAALFLFGCNFGTTIADQPPGSGASGGTGNGGSSGAASGGSTGASSSNLPGSSTGGETGSVTPGGPIGTGGVSSLGGESGTAGAPDAGGGKDTGGVVGGANGLGGASGAGGATTACIPAASPGPSGMNTGRACITCHGSGQKPKITAGGTLYSTLAGGAAVAGATVTITGSDGKSVKLVTGNSGNFYTGAAIAFPATIQVSKCPTTAAMTMTAPDGDCNGCHKANIRIHLP